MENNWKNFKDISRENWGKDRFDEKNCPEDEIIKLGAILRIADACEIMSKTQKDLYKENNKLWDKIAKLEKKIKRLKKNGQK